jgi:LCP family protein required for cell wall assembly
MKTRLFFLFVCFTLLACSLFSPSAPPDDTSPLADILNGKKNTSWEETPGVPTSTPVEILLDSAEDGIAKPEPVARSNFPPPSVEPVIALPPLAEAIPQSSGTVNVLLLGSDARGPFGGQRTDTILMVSFHPKRGMVSVISFPRDLYVYIPGWTVRRINEAYQYGGFESLADTFDYNFGLRPVYYVLVNFEAFQQAVDNLGGIDVQVAQALREGNYSVKPGLVHMDGEMALWYVRSRYTSSDFDRMRRQQEVLVALFGRMVSLNALEKVPQMYKLYGESVTTNIRLQETLSWAGVARRIADDADTIQALTIGRDLVTPYRTPAGAQVLLPKSQVIWETLYAMLVQ